jgi:hypothetical protein
MVLRVVLRASLDAAYVLNPFDLRGWEARVEAWRTRVASPSIGASMQVSAAALSGSGLNTNHRAVVDLYCLGGTTGDLSVSTFAHRLDSLVPGIDVLSLSLIPAMSESGRGAVLVAEVAKAPSIGDRLKEFASDVKGLVVLVVVALVAVAVIASKRK